MTRSWLHRYSWIDWHHLDLALEAAWSWFHAGEHHRDATIHLGTGINSGLWSSQHSLLFFGQDNLVCVLLLSFKDPEISEKILEDVDLCVLYFWIEDDLLPHVFLLFPVGRREIVGFLMSDIIDEPAGVGVTLLIGCFLLKAFQPYRVFFMVIEHFIRFVLQGLVL